MSVHVAVVHGPNLQLLGTREPEVYGSATLDHVNADLEALADELGVTIEAFQSNHEGDILDFVADAGARADGILINPGALTHTSIALRDALAGTGLPFVEIHISNTSARESFRARSFLSPIASGVVFGFGVQSYLLGLRGLVDRLARE